MDEKLRSELRGMMEEDHRVREELVREGSLWRDIIREWKPCTKKMRPG